MTGNGAEKSLRIPAAHLADCRHLITLCRRSIDHAKPKGTEAVSYTKYQDEVRADILNVFGQAACQPILFVGSGFSKRYIGAPNWEELLKTLAQRCPLIVQDFAYYKQKRMSFIEIGSLYSESYREWAWTDGKENFPQELYSEQHAADSFIKYETARIILELEPKDIIESCAENLRTELQALRAMSPHAIITTNYDQTLEHLFPEYEKIVGQQLLTKPYLSVGEIFKIHGCSSTPSSIVLTAEDYLDFEKDKRYLSAKLLTYFAEHPLLFVGYSANDPNVKSVLYDVSRMFKAAQETMPNIYILEWDDSITDESYPARDRILNVADGVNIRIKSITAKSFSWVFEAFGNNGAIDKINVKLLRALMARTINLVRRDIPTKRIEVNFQTLEHAVDSDENFAKILGITTLDGAANINAQYPYTLQLVAEKLGYPTWHKANKLIELLCETTGFDMKESDNPYHFKLKTGKGDNSFTRKYSDATVTVLDKLRKGEPFKLSEGCI